MLSSNRDTRQSTGDLRQGLLAAGAMIFAGALVMRNAAGLLVQGQAGADLIGVGRAQSLADNSDGLDGETPLIFEPGIFCFDNSTGGDEITDADIGAKCFAVDDHTVARTNAGGTLSVAGFVDHVDAQGVWVRFDEALARL